MGIIQETTRKTIGHNEAVGYSVMVVAYSVMVVRSAGLQVGLK